VSDEKPTVTLFTPEPVQLVFIVTQPDERQPDKYVLTTLTEDRRLARRPVTLEEGAQITSIVGEPRQLLYVATEDDPGIFALLYALVPRESAAWEDDENQEVEAVYLGTVVRASECRAHPGDLTAEAVDHFAAILGGQTIEPIEQLLKRLT
jgi:hypothetical protein